jgi:hypothetical protein
MNNEFKKINNNNITRYVLEDGSSGGATSGGTSAGSISSFEKPMGGIQRRTGDDLIHQENKKSYKVSHKPKNPVAKAHQTVGTGSGAHTDKTKVIPRKEKHKKTADMTLENFNAEYDDEAGMADNNLETMKRAVDGLDSLIHKGDNLPEWCQEKIAVAKSMLVAVWDYMQSEEHGMAEGDDSFQSQFDKKNAKVMKPANPVQFVKREINNNCERDGCAPGELNRNILAGIAQQSGLSLRDVLRIRNMMDPVMQQGVAEDSAHGYNVVRYYEKTSDLKKLTNWLCKEAGLEKNAPVYFDDVDLVYSDKTIVPGALVNPKLKFNDLLTALVRATGGQGKQNVDGVYRSQGLAEDTYLESLNAKLAEKLDPNAEPEVWVQDFQKANPNKYHQFKNKTPQKKAQMAVAARRDARLKK